VERALSLDKRFFLSDHNFIYTDKMSMAAGVEVRVPFLDNDLVQIAASIPTHLKQKLFHGKWVLKKALEGTLPKDVIYRPKTGFGAPLRRWIGNDLKPMIDEYLSDNSIKNRGIFNARMVRKLITDTENGKIDGSYTIFSILCIEIWCKKFLKSESILL
jgi:asparagine synthase (glutamine-hydrolysing)